MSEELANTLKTMAYKIALLRGEVNDLKRRERPASAGDATPILSAVYPIGSIYLSTSATNPGSLFGGTWVAWGTGRVAVGVDVNQSEFNAVEKTGGAKQHAHGLASGYAKIVNNVGGWVSGARKTGVPSFTTTHRTTGSTGAYTENVKSATELGGNTDNGSTLPPYITCYMWKRTA